LSFRIFPAALAGLLILSGAPSLPASAQDAKGAGNPPPDAAKPDDPEVGPPAPLPGEPKDAVKKAAQAILRKWSDDEPSLPEKRTESEVKADRAKAAGELVKLIQDWNASIAPGNCLRMVAWWKARLEETQPSENHGTGIHPKEDFTTRTGKFPLAVSLPASYRGKGTEVYPLILTVIDKEADPRKVLTAVYGKLLDTHIVVAGFESSIKAPQKLLDGLLYAYYSFRIDRDRVLIDGIGKGARFVEELAVSDTSALQWNGAVFRSPAMTSPLAGNLGLFPCAVLEPPSPTGPVATAILTIKTQTKTEVVPAPTPADEGALQKVRDWITALPPRKVADQKNPYTMWFRSSRGNTWGFWFVFNQAVEGPPDQPTVRMKISRDPKHNRVDLECVNLAAGTLLLNDEVLDLDKAVVVRVNGIVVAREIPLRNAMLTFDAIGGWATTSWGPRDYFITAQIPFVVEGDARTLQADREAIAAREKAEEERRRQEEEAAKNPKPVPPIPPVPDGASVDWSDSLNKILENAKKEHKPVFLHFSDNGADRQKDVDDALAQPEVLKVLRDGYWCVWLHADRDKDSQALLVEKSGTPDAKAPFLAILDSEDGKFTKTLPASTLKKEEVLPRVRELLAVPAAAVIRILDFESARAEAMKSGKPLVGFFSAAPEAKGQAALLACLADDPEVRKVLDRVVFVRLETSGADPGPEKNRGILDSLAKGAAAPLLLGVSFPDDKTSKVLGSLAPADPPEADFAAKVLKALGEWAPVKQAAADPPKTDDKPGEKKDAPPAPPTPPPTPPAPEEKKDGPPPKPDEPPKPDAPK
jgi:hypothetical protein